MAHHTRKSCGTVSLHARVGRDAEQARVGTLLLALIAAVLIEPRLATVRPASAQSAITVIDVVGRSVTVNVPVQRVPVQRGLLGEGRHLYSIAAIESQDPFARIVGEQPVPCNLAPVLRLAAPLRGAPAARQVAASDEVRGPRS